MPRRVPEGISAYIAVTAAYWSFMLTDGALRMLVLLHFHTLGFTPVQLAYLFVLYEIAGVVTNLSAGWIAARFGLTRTLYVGLGLQVVALVALSRLDPAWAIGTSVAFVMLVQGASGVAKDLSKMSSKSAVKLLAPTEGDGLFRWVALLTGSKNAVKGLGFLLGAGLLATAGFTVAVLAMAAVLAVILAVILVAMPTGLPTGRKGAKFSEVFSKSSNVNWLSAARVTLFGARDVWFVVGIPIYFYAVLSDGSTEGNRAAFFMIGTFMAVWIILYGAVQAAAPPAAQGRVPPAGGADRRGTRLGGGAGGGARASGHRGGGDAGSGPVADGDARRRSAGLRRAVRGEFLAPLLPDPGLHSGRAGDDGCGLLLYGERGGSADRDGSVRPDIPAGRLAADTGHGGGAPALFGMVGRTSAAIGARKRWWADPTGGGPVCHGRVAFAGACRLALCRYGLTDLASPRDSGTGVFATGPVPTKKIPAIQAN